MRPLSEPSENGRTVQRGAKLFDQERSFVPGPRRPPGRVSLALLLLQASTLITPDIWLMLHRHDGVRVLVWVGGCRHSPGEASHRSIFSLGAAPRADWNQLQYIRGPRGNSCDNPNDCVRSVTAAETGARASTHSIRRSSANLRLPCVLFQRLNRDK